MNSELLSVKIISIETKIPNEIYNQIGSIIIQEINTKPNPDEYFAPYVFPFENIEKISQSDNIEYKENIRNMADDLWSKEMWLDALIVYYILMHITTFLPTDFYKFGYTLAKLNKPAMAQDIINLYEKEAVNKKVACHAIANFYYTALNIPKKAIDYFEKYLEFDPNNAQTYATLSFLYSQIKDYTSKDKEFNAIKKAYDLDSKNPVIVKRLLTYYEKEHNIEQVKRLYPELIKIAPSPRHSLNYGLYLISWGKINEGHKYFLERFDLDEYPIGYPKSILGLNTKWNYKDDISDKMLVVHWEEGFGDSIMYSRFLPLIKQFAKKVVLIVQPELVNLFKTSPVISNDIEIFGGIKDFVSKYKDSSYVHMPLMDLPYPLGIDSHFIPYSNGYISATNPKKFDKSKINIGIAYSGDTSSNYNDRNIELKEFYNISKIDGVQLYSLQVGESSNQMDNLPSDVSIINLGESLKDFTDTANVIAGLDFIISSDNVVLNLAGAMGKLTLGIFNKYPNYRWFNLTGDNVIWYDSVIPFQCEEENNWNFVMEKIYNTVQSAVIEHNNKQKD